MNREVAHLNRRQSAPELNPFLSAVNREEKTKLGADEKQIRVDVIFGNESISTYSRPNVIIWMVLAFQATRHKQLCVIRLFVALLQ